MKTEVYNQDKTKKQQVELPESVFGLKVNTDLVHQVVVSQLSNRRQGTVQAKTRSEVSGGGRKPWKQKGTGRARHGSIRSPLWRGGGITFGPRNEKNYQKTIPNKIRRLALLMALSAKTKANLLIVVDSLALKSPKTKLAFDFLSQLPLEGTTLIITASYNESFYRSARNIAKVSIMEARNLNALDVMSFKNVVVEKSGVQVIQEIFANEKSKVKSVA
ncbi:MAG: 50S ribosomal protein L4 [Candidatus Gribaldobacteria bacterium]|nr:50S ribosomal protein L4 [Candidatus Gribaldobacteria bacterium]